MGHSNGKYVLTPEDIVYVSNFSGMPQKEVKLRFEQFCQKYPNGKIPKDEYISMLRTLFKNTDAERLEQYIFNVYDVDGDGSIDFKEFYLILFVLGGGTPEEKLGHIFRVFDLNHNGFVTRDEVNKIVKDLYPLLGKAVI